MSGELSMKDLDYSFAPQPHNMAVDNAISAEAYRIWGIIHMLKWNRIDPEPESIADLLHVHSRSVRRWLSELDTAQWLKSSTARDKSRRLAPSYPAGGTRHRDTRYIGCCWNDWPDDARWLRGDGPPGSNGTNQDTCRANCSAPCRNWYGETLSVCTAVETRSEDRERHPASRHRRKLPPNGIN